MEYLAHIAEDGRKQTVKEHCEGTARMAADSLSTVMLGKTAFLAGLLHDVGKLQEPFQTYLHKSASGEKVRKGEVIHTFQGCRLLLERYHRDDDNWQRELTSELIAYAIGAHHSLFDCVDDRRKSGFEYRANAKKISYEEVKNITIEMIGGVDKLDAMFAESVHEVEDFFTRLDLLSQSDSDCCFYLGLLARLITSAVIEGDRRDTREFMENTSFVDQPSDMRETWRDRLDYMENKLSDFTNEKPIDDARGKISDICRKSAEKDGGVYRLNVPTGAGKTLSSLRFALAHAAKHNKRRIIFTAPLLTILDQNAKVIREYVGDDSMILEHHSNVIRTEENTDTLDPKELYTENWGSPIIITTLVQLLNTLFDGKTSSIRRFQALCGSVIIIDEVQTVPNNMLTMFNLAVNFLSQLCGVTFVLCSATQPALEITDHPLSAVPEEIVPYNDALWKPFKRTEIVPKELALDEITDFAAEILESADSLLIVCNKKAEAEALFRRLSNTDASCFHLSASMCMAHRRKVLNEMETALDNIKSKRSDTKVICVSTQVIEAGVDISFQRVVRLMAGMDSVVQSAGRCNRHGEDEIAPVYMVKCVDERLNGLRSIEEGKRATIDLLNEYRQSTEKFQNSLASDKAIRYYYDKLYSSHGGHFQDYVIENGSFKGVSIFDLLSENTEYYDEDCRFDDEYYLNQAFKIAGSLFQVFDENTEDIVVPYGEGRVLIEELACVGEHPSGEFLRGWLQRVKPYTISLYDEQLRRLNRMGGVYSIGGILVLQPEFYDEKMLGFSINNSELDFLEV